MSNQIQLEWSVSVADTTFSPAQAAAALGAVVLYLDTTTDPVLGQFGLTVASDVTATVSGGATRTLTLNMTSVPGTPFAPPPFPCHPNAPSSPVLPYALERTVPLPGGFTVQNGSAIVPTTANQTPSLNNGDLVQFASQLGTSYTVSSFTTTALTLTAPYTGEFANTGAFKVLAAPSKLPALYSTSALDDAAGSGARTVLVSYTDSLGAASTSVVTLAGKRPVQMTLTGGTVDVASITGMHVASTGLFLNSVGQITLVDLSAPIAWDDTDDQAQLKIDRRVAYMPQSYFAFVQQGATRPTLAGDLQAVPGSPEMVSTVDQTSALAAGNVVQLAAQPGVDYTVALVTPRIVTFTTPYSGLVPVTTSATRTVPSPAAPPTADQLMAPLAQYINPGNVLPSGAMTPAPTFLSSFFTQTISVALAVPVTSSAIALV